MYLHIGNNKNIRVRDIVGIFDADTATVSAITKKYLSAADHNKSVIFASEEIPRNIVVGPDGTILYHSSGGSKKELQKVIALCREQVALLEAQQTSK